VDPVHPDAVLAQLGRQDLGDRRQRRLRARVGAEARPHAHRRHRVDHHDAAVALADHLRGDGLGELQCAEEVDVHRRPPPGEVGVEEPAVVAVGERVVHEDVEAAEPLDHGGDGGGARVGVGDVEADGEGGRAPLGDLGGQRLRAPGGPGADHDRRPLAAERQRHVPAQARTGARHERDLPLQQTHVTLLPVDI
jgi:hypothetical protein